MIFLCANKRKSLIKSKTNKIYRKNDSVYNNNMDKVRYLARIYVDRKLHVFILSRNVTRLN